MRACVNLSRGRASSAGLLEVNEAPVTLVDSESSVDKSVLSGTWRPHQPVLPLAVVGPHRNDTWAHDRPAVFPLGSRMLVNQTVGGK